MVSPKTLLVFSARGLAACLFIFAPCPAQEPAPVPITPVKIVPVLRASSAEAQLAGAKGQKRAAQGLKGEARILQLHKAARAYAAVPHYWPKQKPLVVEACYRRGEILRTLAEAGAARGAFEEVLEAATEGDDFAVRALLEIGHICRRASQHRDAIAYYRLARDRKKVSLRYNNDGREWLARTLLQVFAWKEAKTAALDWSQHAETSVEQVKAQDLRILALVGAKELRAAERALTEFREQMDALAAVPSKEGQRLRKALERMKAPKVLDVARQNGR